MKKNFLIWLVLMVTNSFAQEKEYFLINTIPNDEVLSQMKELRNFKDDTYDPACEWGQIKAFSCVVVNEPCTHRFYKKKDHINGNATKESEKVRLESDARLLASSYIINRRENDFMKWFDQFLVSPSLNTYVEAYKNVGRQDIDSFKGWVLKEQVEEGVIYLSDVTSAFISGGQREDIKKSIVPIDSYSSVDDNFFKVNYSSKDYFELGGVDLSNDKTINLGFVLNPPFNLKDKIESPDFEFLHIEGHCGRVNDRLNEFNYDVMIDVYASNDQWSEKLGVIKYRINNPARTIEDLHFISESNVRHTISSAISVGDCPATNGPILLLPISSEVGSWSKLSKGPWGREGWIKLNSSIDSINQIVSYKIDNKWVSHFSDKQQGQVTLHVYGESGQVERVSENRIFSDTNEFLPKVELNCERLDSNSKE